MVGACVELPTLFQGLQARYSGLCYVVASINSAELAFSTFANVSAMDRFLLVL